MFDKKIDIWSLGCIFYELYTGNVLFNGKNSEILMGYYHNVLGSPPKYMIKNPISYNKLYSNNKYNKYNKNQDLYEIHSNNPDYYELIYKCIKMDPLLRPDALTLLTYNVFKCNDN